MSESISVTRKPSKIKSYSASEIARNPRFFEKWSTAQRCWAASWRDIPDEIREDVEAVFDTSARLPGDWVNPDSAAYGCLETFMSPELLRFLRTAHQDRPELFSDAVDATACRDILTQIQAIFTAWKSLTTNLDEANKEPWSEADYVANVHNTCRATAVGETSYRVQTTLSLPQPLSQLVTNRTVRIVNSTTIVPDNLIFLPKRLSRNLSSGLSSPFSRLKRDAAVQAISDTSSPERSFIFQATPCAQIPQTEGFEFVSSVSEDKKTTKEGGEEAYRQNRMAATSVIRHLAALGVEPLPIFGLVWENGTVRAHVDWYSSENGERAILSAPYRKADAADENVPHKWQLAAPGDMIEVFLLLRNIDAWTVDGFYQRVKEGVTRMADGVCGGTAGFEPWRRAGDLVPTPLPPPSPKKLRSRRRKSRTSTGTASSGMLSSAGAHRMTVVRQDVVQETVRSDGRTRRTQRLSLESVEVEEVEVVPVPDARAAGKGKARATTSAASESRARSKAKAVMDKVVLPTVEEVAPKRVTRGKTPARSNAAGPSRQAESSTAAKKKSTIEIFRESGPSGGSPVPEQGRTRLKLSTSWKEKENKTRLASALAAEKAAAAKAELRRSPRKRE